MTMTKEELRKSRLENLARGRAAKKEKAEAGKNVEETTTDIVPMVPETHDGNGSNGGQNPIMEEMYNPFSQHEGFSSIKTLVDPGEADKLESLLMRGCIPDKPSMGNIALVHITHLYDQYTRHGYERGKQRLRNLLAGYPSIKGERAQMVVDAIIGERQQRRAENRSFADKLGDTAKNGFGGNKKGSE